MSLLNHLQLQPIDDAISGAPFIGDDEEINLKEQIDERELENYWEEVSEDLERDPDWFTFVDE
jgi:hypothetical protein